MRTRGIVTMPTTLMPTAMACWYAAVAVITLRPRRMQEPLCLQRNVCLRRRQFQSRFAGRVVVVWDSMRLSIARRILRKQCGREC